MAASTPACWGGGATRGLEPRSDVCTRRARPRPNHPDALLVYYTGSPLSCATRPTLTTSASLCKRKGDLTATALFDDGQTILDVGIHHPTIDSSINTLSSEVRAAGANRYAAAKDRRAHKTIKDNAL